MDWPGNRLSFGRSKSTLDCRSVSISKHLSLTLAAAGISGQGRMSANKEVASNPAAAFSIDDVDELRRVLDAVPHPIFIKDEHHRSVVANQAMCEFMGQPHERLVGKTDDAFVPKEHADVFQRADRLVLDTGQDHENEEVIPGNDGTMRTIVTRKKRVCLANGARLIIGSISDISEVKLRETSWRLL